MPRKKQKKIFVLDTSVILYNHNAINSFDDNDVAIPITVLEELDNFKKGNETKNFEAREFIRIMDRLSNKGTLQNWIQLEFPKSGMFKVQMNEAPENGVDAIKIFGDNKPDHRILNAAIRLSEEKPGYKVILVTKDVNLRIKAKSLDIPSEDFETGKIKDVDSLYSGITYIENVNPDAINKIYAEGLCNTKDIGIDDPYPNHYFIIRNDKASVLAYYNPLLDKIERVEKRPAHKILPRNAEQVFALHAILNPKIKLVTLQGVAGTGKTLLALAGALDQKRNYKQIYLARPIVPLSNKDIGYLPGDIKSKLNPYMEPLWDNLKFIQNQYGEKDKEYKRINEAVESEKLLINLWPI